MWTFWKTIFKIYICIFLKIKYEQLSSNDHVFVIALQQGLQLWNDGEGLFNYETLKFNNWLRTVPWNEKNTVKFHKIERRKEESNQMEKEKKKS